MGSVVFQHVYKYYKGEAKPAVKDFHLDVADGEFLILVGPSGCGKSTTLRMLAGLEEVSKGDIYIDDEFVNYVSPKDRDIAMVFQNYSLYPNLSVFQNLSLGLQLRKVAKHEVELRVKHAARILEIEHLLDRRPNQLSGGQKQRVALGRAIVRKPKVFLMDEPLSNLDAKLRAQTRAEICLIQRNLKTTTIYVTHDQTEAMTMGTRIVVMKDGIIQQVDAPQMLYDFPQNRFVAGFIGSPQMNFIEGGITNEDGKLYFETRRLRLPLPETYHGYMLQVRSNIRQISLGLRPEHIRMNSGIKQANEEWLVDVKVEMIERMGADTYIYIRMGAELLIMRDEAHTRASVGERLKVEFRMDQAHYFDQDGGHSLINREDLSWLMAGLGR